MSARVSDAAPISTINNHSIHEPDKIMLEKLNDQGYVIPELKSIENDEDDDDMHELLESDESSVGKMILKVRSRIFKELKRPIYKWIFYGVLIIAFPVYFGFAMHYNNPFDFHLNENTTNFLDEQIFSNNRGLALFVLTCIAVLLIAWELLFNRLRNLVSKNQKKLPKIQMPKLYYKIKPFFVKFQAWFYITIVFILCAVYLLIDINDYYNLVSLAGLATFILVCILLSKHPSMINWRALAVGCLIQFILGVFVLRLEFGYKLFKFFGDQVTIFLDYTDNGCELVFGQTFRDHYFAFKVMMVIIYFSSLVNVLYFYGIIQYFLLKIAWIMNFLMGTSPAESVVTVASIFLGTVEAPLLVKPLMPNMTNSELFAIMTAAYSTVSGSILAAYIGFGVKADRLITASLMSAPASLAIAKTLYPETRKTKADWNAIRNVKINNYNNVFEAIGVGAIEMLKPIGGIIANVVAFVSIFGLLDQICVWIFSMVQLEDFGLASILQYLFWPFAFLMGVAVEDCKSVSKLVGYKIFLNEFVAYQKLGQSTEFRDSIIANGTYELYKNGTLSVPNNIGMIWNDRSIAISTYALCGFSNFGTIGIEIATLTAFVPKRTKAIVKMAGVAMLGGNMSAFMNACIAGLLYKKIE